MKFKGLGLNSPTRLNHPLLDIINKPDVAEAITQAYQRQIKTTLKYIKWCSLKDGLVHLLAGPMVSLVGYLATRPFGYADYPHLLLY
jgi:hypothetical protein